MQKITWQEYWEQKTWEQKIAALVAQTLAVFQIYTSLFGALDSLLQRSIHLALGLIILFLIRPGLVKRKNPVKPSWLDWIIILFVIAAAGYQILHYDWLMGERFPLISSLTWSEIVLGIGTIFIVLEATRRLFSKGLFIIGLVFLIYPFIGQYLGGIFHASAVAWTDVIDFNYLSLGGIYGIPLGVSATEIALFVIFGSILLHSGGALLFSNLAMALTGSMVGGPAKVSVIASALMGTITGSGAANVATTGVVTIPMMKKAGYKPEFAGAVEAVASTGGQLMPPVMGAAAFVMAAFSGIPYSTIIYYALLPALLFFISVLVTVDLEARRLKLPGMKPDSTVMETIKTYGHMLIPLCILIYVLMAGYTPRLAGGWGVISAILFAQLRSSTRMGLAGLMAALEDGCKGLLIIIVSTAVAGIIVGSVDLTGLGNRLGTAFIGLSGGYLLPALFMAMIISIILGAGMPTTPAYIVQVATVIPALTAMGLAENAAHMFAFYFSCLSLISPPVAAAAFTAAAIAQSDGWKTGWVATRIGAVAFVVPFMFAYDQSLLLQGPALKILVDFSTACLGASCFAIAGVGYLFRNLKWYDRILALVLGISLIMPDKRISMVGVVLLVFFVLIQIYGNRRAVTKEFARTANGSPKN